MSEWSEQHPNRDEIDNVENELASFCLTDSVALIAGALCRNCQSNKRNCDDDVCYPKCFKLFLKSR